MTKLFPALPRSPARSPEKGRGGRNTRGAGKSHGQDGNGAQKRKQDKRT